MSTYGNATVTQEIISSATDKVVKLNGSCFARPVSLTGGWSKVRVGIRFLFTDFKANASVISGNPRLFLGLCHGTANQVGDLSTSNFVGLVTDGNWTYQVSEVLWDFITLRAATRVGTTLSTSGTALNTVTCQYGTGVAPPWFPSTQCLFVDITKGSPNFTINAYHCQNAQVAGAISASTYLSNIVLSSPSISNHALGTGQTMAVDEGTNGTLDTVTVSWNRSDFFAEISDFGVVVLA